MSYIIGLIKTGQFELSLLEEEKPLFEFGYTKVLATTNISQS